MLQLLRIINGLRGMFRSGWTYFGHTSAILFHQVYCRAGGPALRDPGYPPEDTKEAIEILSPP